jgi:hypothetical protein
LTKEVEEPIILFLILVMSVIIITTSTISVSTSFVLSQTGGGAGCNPEWQRGQCLYDAGGKYYYDADNCSQQPGSSGRPGISECQEAGRELQKEEKEHTQ